MREGNQEENDFVGVEGITGSVKKLESKKNGILKKNNHKLKTSMSFDQWRVNIPLLKNY